MDKELKESIKAAYLEFEKEPMDAYYNNIIAGYPSRLRVKRILKELGNIKGKNVLDVGCEAGYVSIRTANKGAKVYAFDICEPALEKFKKRIAKMNNKNITVFKALAQKIPVKSNTMDAVICTETIEHMPQLEKVFSELNRVMKENSKLIITFPNESLRKRIYPLVNLLGINAGTEKEVTLFEYTKEEIINKLKKHFKIHKSYTIPKFFPLTNIIVCKK